MQVKINNQTYDIVVIEKPHNKNTYLRVKENLKIYVTTPKFSTDYNIKQLINKNIVYITKMIAKQEDKINYNNKFHYLGKNYKLELTNDTKLFVTKNTIYIPKNINIDKLYLKSAKKVFKEHLDKCYQEFNRKIPYPNLIIRKMKTRWGVCNYKLNKITLNLELIKKDTKYLDYVIIHELAHFIYHNHNYKFWQLVEENYPNYKKIRKELNEYK